MSLELPATTHLQGLKCQSKLLHAVEQLSLELLDCELKFTYISFWLALKGRAKFAMSTMHAVVLFADHHPPEGDKDTNNIIPRSNVHLLLWFPYKNRAGGYFREPSSGWLQPVEPTFFSPVLFNNNKETNADFVA